MRITLTPGQSVTIHGWLRARQHLTWGDVLASDTLNFPALLSFNISEQELYVLQPDLQAWIRHGKATLNDCPRMRPWDSHPVKDFKADLSDIIRCAWSTETMSRVSLSYDDLTGLGLTHDSMPLLNFTLMMWANIGFHRGHAERIPPNTLFNLFGMSKQNVLASLRLP